MRISDLENEDEMIQQQAAELFMSCSMEASPGLRFDLQFAIDEVKNSFAPGRISLVAIDRQRVAGWGSAIRQYNGHNWEIRPLVVNRAYRRRGIGRSLFKELQDRVVAHGALTMWVSLQDEIGSTSLWGQELYPNPLVPLQDIRNLNGHPYSFFERLGFSITGVLPDANGFGKPDIFLSKRIRSIN